MRFRSVLKSLSAALICLFVCAATARAGDDWKPVDPAQLAMTSPIVEKDADAEAIFLEVRVQDDDMGGEFRTVLNHHIRIKIFTERGKESQGKIDILYFG